MSTTQEILEIIIQGTDKASGEFGKASTALEKLGGIGKGILTVGMTAAAAGVAALGAGLGIAVSEAMEAQAGLAQLDAVLESTGGAAGVTRDMALELADSLSAVTRFSDDSVLAAENLLLTFTNIGADVFPRATETLLDMATAMGTDAKSGAIQLGKALNDPVAGITALTRVGVTFTEEQKAAIASMVEMGDVAGAQAIILSELEKEFGGSAEAAGQTFAGQLDILKNSLLNVAEGVGMALLPLLQDLTSFVTENVLPWVQGAGDGFARLLGIVADNGWGALFTVFEDGSSWLGSFFETIGLGEEQAQALMQWAKDLKIDFDNFLLSLQPVFDAFQNLSNAIIESFPLMQEQGAAFMDWLNQAFGITFPTLITNVTGIINGLAALWREHGDTVLGVVDALTRGLVATLGGAMVLISGIVNSALLLLQGDWQGAWDAMKTSLETFMNLTLSLVGSDLDEFIAIWTGVFANAKIIWDTFWDDFITTWTGNWDMLVTIWDTFWTNFIGTWQTNWDNFQLIVDTVIQNVMGFFDNLKQTINGIFSTIQSLIEKIAGISLPDIPGTGGARGNTGAQLTAEGGTGSAFGGAGKPNMQELYNSLTPEQQAAVQALVGGGIGSEADYERAIMQVLGSGGGTAFGDRNGKGKGSTGNLPFGGRGDKGGGGDPFGGRGDKGEGTAFGGFGGGGGSKQIILNIYTSAPLENILDDFAMLEALAAG